MNDPALVPPALARWVELGMFLAAEAARVAARKTAQVRQAARRGARAARNAAEATRTGRTAVEAMRTGRDAAEARRAGRAGMRGQQERRRAFATRRPGAETPLWNVCAGLLREELAPFGAKVRLARYLGIPRQRLNDFLTGRSRLPDAELTLLLLHWLAEKRAGRDVSL